MQCFLSLTVHVYEFGYNTIKKLSLPFFDRARPRICESWDPGPEFAKGRSQNQNWQNLKVVAGALKHWAGQKKHQASKYFLNEKTNYLFSRDYHNMAKGQKQIFLNLWHDLTSVWVTFPQGDVKIECYPQSLDAARFSAAPAPANCKAKNYEFVTTKKNYFLPWYKIKINQNYLNNND